VEPLPTTTLNYKYLKWKWCNQRYSHEGSEIELQNVFQNILFIGLRREKVNYIFTISKKIYNDVKFIIVWVCVLLLLLY